MATNEEILKLLYDETLVGNAPAVKKAKELIGLRREKVPA
jgi:hypothetical protein